MLRGMSWHHRFTGSMIVIGTWLCSLAMTSCAGSRPDSAAEARMDEDLVTRLSRWTLLDGAARTTASGSSGAHLVWMKPGEKSGRGPKSQAQLTRACRAITSVASVPGSPAELVLVEDGRLRLARIAGPGITQGLIIATTPPDLRVSRILAIARQGNELELVVTLAGAAAESQRMSRVVVDMATNKATRHDLAEQPRFRSRRAFYTRFTVPICQREDTDCLVIGGASDINIQARPGEPHDHVLTLALARVFDAIWDMRTPGSLLVLTRCDRDAE